MTVNLEIKHMELNVERREVCNGPSRMTDTEVLSKFELMDGSPVGSLSIPVRLISPPCPTRRNFRY